MRPVAGRGKRGDLLQPVAGRGGAFERVILCMRLRGNDPCNLLRGGAFNGTVLGVPCRRVYDLRVLDRLLLALALLLLGLCGARLTSLVLVQRNLQFVRVRAPRSVVARLPTTKANDGTLGVASRGTSPGMPCQDQCPSSGTVFPWKVEVTTVVAVVSLGLRQRDLPASLILIPCWGAWSISPWRSWGRGSRRERRPGSWQATS